MGTFKEYPEWVEKVKTRYCVPYDCMIDQFYNQLWKLTGQEPKAHFVNAFVNQLQMDTYPDPTNTICRYVELVYKIESPETQFPEQINRIRENLNKLYTFLKEINFAISSQIIFEELDKIPIHLN